MLGGNNNERERERESESECECVCVCVTTRRIKKMKKSETLGSSCAKEVREKKKR